MEKQVNIPAPPISVNIMSDAQGAVVRRLDVSVVMPFRYSGSSIYGASEPTRTKCQEIAYYVVYRCPYRKPTQVDYLSMVRRSRETLLRNSAS